jgi:hypothetical protein
MYLKIFSYREAGGGFSSLGSLHDASFLVITYSLFEEVGFSL